MRFLSKRHTFEKLIARILRVSKLFGIFRLLDLAGEIANTTFRLSKTVATWT